MRKNPLLLLLTGVFACGSSTNPRIAYNDTIATSVLSRQALSTAEYPSYQSFEPKAQKLLFRHIAKAKAKAKKNPDETRIPIFVITCDRITVLIKTLLSFYIRIETPFEIVIQDNHTTYPPTLDFLRKLQQAGITVIFRDEDVTRDVGLNAVTHTVAWWYEDHDAPYYVVTDPDIELDEGPGDILTVLASLLDDSPRINVVGPMLHRDDIPEYYPFRALAQDQNWFKFQRWHGHFNGIPSTVQDGYIDTVFGMYRKSFKFHNYNYALQTCRPYMARHLDWYIDPENLAPDQIFYLRKNSPVGHWSSTFLVNSKYR